METLLKQAQFDPVEMYSDMDLDDPGYNDTADFFTYVAFKPTI